jgi:glycosyltransferase involved in cell wall biosynthesis
MKRVLFLAYLFPPIANSGTQRPTKFVKYLPSFGWQPTVLTAAHFDGHRVDHSLLNDIPECARIVRVPMLNEQVGATVASLTGGHRLGLKIAEAISWRLRDRRSSPDLYALWKPTVVRAALRLFHDTGFDAIVATGFPWTSLLAGAEIAAATGRPLIADFRDLWAGESVFRDRRPPREEELALEGSVIERAAMVVTPSLSTCRYLAATHPEAPGEKFCAIRNGFDHADFTGDVERDPAQPFRIVFTGVWKEGYNPAQLYDSIEWIRRSHPRLLDNVEVIAAGFTPGEAERRQLGAHIKEVGGVTHDVAVALMRSADILFATHIDPERQWAIPAKVYEYLASGSPILALLDPDQETAQILRATGGAAIVSADDPGTLYDALARALRERRLDVPPRNAAAMAAFERRNLTAQLAGALDRVVSEAPAAARARRMSSAA